MLIHWRASRVSLAYHAFAYFKALVQILLAVECVARYQLKNRFAFMLGCQEEAALLCVHILNDKPYYILAKRRRVVLVYTQYFAKLSNALGGPAALLFVGTHYFHLLAHLYQLAGKVVLVQGLVAIVKLGPFNVVVALCNLVYKTGCLF